MRVNKRSDESGLSPVKVILRNYSMDGRGIQVTDSVVRDPIWPHLDVFPTLPRYKTIHVPFEKATSKKCASITGAILSSLVVGICLIGAFIVLKSTAQMFF